jgi:hypothetical protein
MSREGNETANASIFAERAMASRIPEALAKAAPVRVPGEVSTERVQRALAMAAGDILQRSKLSPDERMKLAVLVSALSGEYEKLAKEAWES